MDVGDTPIIQAKFYNRDGIPTDPTVVAGWIRKPNDTVSVLVFTNVDVGVWEAPFLITQEGDHWVRMECTGAVQTASEKKFTVTKKMVTTP